MLSIYETVPMIDYWRSSAHYYLGSVAYERNFLDESEDHFQHIEKLHYRLDPRIYHDSFLGLALIALAKDEAMEAGKYISSARNFAIAIKDPSSLEFSNSFKLRLNPRSGKAHL